MESTIVITDTGVKASKKTEAIQAPQRKRSCKKIFQTLLAILESSKRLAFKQRPMELEALF